MPRKRQAPVVSSAFAEGGVGLAVKDGLREVRFNVKRSARKLVKGVQTAIHPDSGDIPGPLGLLSPPLDLAIRTTVQLLRTADHAAIDLLSSDGPYRSMEVPLCSSSAYFSAEHAGDPIRPFTRDHSWRYRHLLALREDETLFVHEQRIERAGQQLRAALAPVCADAHQPPQLLNARIVMALERAEVLSSVVEVNAESPDELRAIGRHLALAVVLAGEIAPLLPGAVSHQTAAALRLADEVCAANLEPLTRSMAHPRPEASLADWMAFALRHI